MPVDYIWGFMGKRKVLKDWRQENTAQIVIKVKKVKPRIYATDC